MRAVGTGRTAASDEALLAQARAGIPAAFDELYARHRGAALRLARSYGRGADGEDLVSEAFERVLGALLGGHGPAEHFRAYLFVTLRRLALEESRQPRSEPLEAVPEAVVAVSGLPTLEEAERRRIALAFESLPERWQAVLWLTAVEGRPPREVARSAGIPANTVSVLAHRARERLREAYLQAHLRAARHPACEPHRSRLGGYVRGGLSRRHRTAMVEHLETCASCRELVVELTDVDRRLVRAVLPLFALVSGGGVAPEVIGGGGALGGAALAGQAAGEGAGLAGAVGATSTTAGTGAGAGVAGAGALKVAVAAAAAVVALTASLLPDLTDPRDGDDAPALAAEAPPGYVPPGAAAVPSAEGSTTSTDATA
ncbi:MAG TPA: sigma-70 family RNA polymerase sigma factor, partial [Acidimicrobiales bacterium]|nr:sigma-70 family RNA polymerase sigma factor [Acidimicrobiales bacterium]